MIPFDEDAFQFPQYIQHLSRLRPKGDRIAEANDLVCILRFDIRKNGLKCSVITVNIRDDRDAHVMTFLQMTCVNCTRMYYCSKRHNYCLELLGDLAPDIQDFYFARNFLYSASTIRI